MTTPVFNLPTSGSDPKRATKEDLEENINQIIQYLDNARIVGDDRGTEGFYNAGPWDASTGVFPTVRKLGGPVQNGDTFFVQDGGAGVVDSQPQFEVGQRIIALVDNPSATTYADNWERANTIAILDPLTARVDAMPIPFNRNSDFLSASIEDIRALANATTGTVFIMVALEGSGYSVDLSQSSPFDATTLGGVQFTYLNVGYGGRFEQAAISDPINGPGSNLLIRNPNAGSTRIHQEPNGYVDSGTVTKYDWMFDPFDDDPINYRILNVYTVTGDPWGTGEGAISAINAKGVGNTWGLWPSIVFGFQDLGQDAVCARMWYGDHNQPEHFTPNKGPWRQGKNVTAGDYVTNNNDIFRAVTSGACGVTAPTHTLGTVSDGGVEWEFIFSPNFNTVRGVFTFGNRPDMPVLGYPDVRSQFLRDLLVGWDAETIYTDNTGALLAKISKDATGGGTNKWWQLETAGGGRLRLHQDDNYAQFVDMVLTFANTDFSADNTVLDVSGKTDLEINYTNPQTITAMTGGVPGQEVSLTLNDASAEVSLAYSTATSGGVMRNPAGTSLALTANGVIKMKLNKTGGFWRQVV